MPKFRTFASLFLYLSLISTLAVRGLSQETDIKKWIKDASVDTQKGAIFKYTYQLKVSYKKKKKMGFGRKFTKIYKAVIPSRFNLNYNYTHPLILIRDSETRITQEAIDSDIENLVAKIERVENAADDPVEQDKKSNNDYWTMQLRADKQNIKIDILKIFEIAQFSNLQEKKIDGNDVVSIDFSPLPALVFDDSLTYISNIEGQIWIDPNTRRIIRVEGFPVGTFAQIRNEPDAERVDKAVFLFIQKKVSEGFWFPDYVKLDFTDNPEIFKPVRLVFNFSDYKKHDTEVRTVNVRAPEETEKTEETVPESETTSEQKDN